MSAPADGGQGANGPEGAVGGVPPEVALPALPSFPKRLVDVVFNPGRLCEALAAHPAWALALAFGAALVVTQTLLIPAEVWEDMFRTTMIERGQEMPESMQNMGSFMRISGLIGGVLFWALFSFLMAGIVTVVFAFVMGDEGRYKQYLAILSHAMIIPAVLGLLLVPLRINAGNPQLTLNVGTFLPFLDDGYVRNVFTYLDLGQIWAWLVVAQGTHTIDPRRSFVSAAVVLMGLSLVMALLFGFAGAPS